MKFSGLLFIAAMAAAVNAQSSMDARRYLGGSRGKGKGRSSAPSSMPSAEPSALPSAQPSAKPSAMPSSKPTVSTMPSAKPSAKPSAMPSAMPSAQPSAQPSDQPSDQPSAQPTISFTQFQQYFGIVFVATGEVTRDQLLLVAEAFVVTYNNLVGGFPNTFKVEMLQAFLPHRRRLGDVQKIFENFFVNGQCRGCEESDSMFTSTDGVDLPTEAQLLEALQIMLKKLDIGEVVTAHFLDEDAKKVPPPTPAPVVPPTDAPVPAPTDAPVPAPTDAPVPAPTDAPVIPPSPTSRSKSSRKYHR